MGAGGAGGLDDDEMMALGGGGGNPGGAPPGPSSTAPQVASVSPLSQLTNEQQLALKYYIQQNPDHRPMVGQYLQTGNFVALQRVIQQGAQIYNRYKVQMQMKAQQGRAMGVAHVQDSAALVRGGGGGGGGVERRLLCLDTRFLPFPVFLFFCSIYSWVLITLHLRFDHLSSNVVGQSDETCETSRGQGSSGQREEGQ